MREFKDRWSDTEIILGHDWLTGMRGGERVLEILCRGLPDSPIFSLIHDPAQISDVINSHPVHTSWLQAIPGITRNYRMFLPLFPSAVDWMNLPRADLLISASHCIAKGLPVAPGTKHLCYCFTPMRYAWLFYEEYFGKNRIKAVVARPLLAALRAWDRKRSEEVDRFVAISRHVQKRIKDFYGRDSDVVYPPVDIDRCSPGNEGTGGEFDLIVSALVPYKRIDLAIRAYGKSGYPLKIVGTGSELPRLRAIAGPNVEFLGWQPDQQVLEFYRACRMLVFPGEEDFGIVPVEAQACGKPVVAYGRGGALETVKENVSGLFFEEQTADSLLDAVRRCGEKNWDPAAIRMHSREFSTEQFVQRLSESMVACMDNKARCPSRKEDPKRKRSQ
jgi:glycosyltransferase involved in cell wall biosynthesis